MKLNQYPKAIASKKREVVMQARAVRQAEQALVVAAATIERQVVFDPELKNENQRKLRRTELQQEGTYPQLLQARDRAKEQLTLLEIETQELRDKFSALKLEWRDRIAQQESLTA